MLYQKCSLNEQKISTRYIPYHIAQLYDHPCPETAFIDIKLCKTKEWYEKKCNQIFKDFI